MIIDDFGICYMLCLCVTALSHQSTRDFDRHLWGIHETRYLRRQHFIKYALCFVFSLTGGALTFGRGTYFREGHLLSGGGAFGGGGLSRGGGGGGGTCVILRYSTYS